MSDEYSLTVQPMAAALGAEIYNFDLRAIDDGAFAAIHQAWLDHQVLLFRDQELSDDDLVAFSRWFGDLDEAPVQETGQRFVEGHPEIYVVSNVVQDGVPIGSLGAGEAVWHTDMSYLPDAAESERALRARSAAGRRRHQLLLDVCRLGAAAGSRCSSAPPGCV